MTTRMKGFCKGFKYISHFFVVKEREMEIGYPTDVKHLAHIGWDGPDHGSAPSWMSEFKTSADFSVASVGGSSWSSQDFELSMGRHPSSSIFSNFPPTNLPSLPKKQKRKKGKSSSLPTKSSSSPKLNSSRGSSRLSRASTLHG